MAAWDALAGPSGQRIALALTHFLWQGTLVAVLGMLLARVLRVSRAESRCLLALATLVVMAACPVATYLVLPTPAAEPVAESLPRSKTYDTQSDFHRSPSAEGVAPREPIRVPAWRRWGAIAPSYVVTGWMLGVVALSARLAAGLVGLSALVSGSCLVPAERLPPVARLARQLSLSFVPRVLVSDRIGEGMVLGFVRPVVLLPAAWLAQSTPEVLEAVLAHELAHLRRGDLWINAVQRVIETVLFYHPAIWWISNWVRVEREMCCDALAVRTTGRRVEYVQALEALARMRCAPGAPALGAAIGGNKMVLLDRVRYVLGIASPRRLEWPVGVALLVTVLLAAAVLAAPAVPAAQPAATKSAAGDGTTYTLECRIISGPKPLNVWSPAGLVGWILPVHHEEDTLLCPKVSVFSGQTAKISDQSQTPLLKSNQGRPGEAWPPKIEMIPEGTAIQATIREEAGDMVSLDVTIELAKIGDNDDPPVHVQDQGKDFNALKAVRHATTATRIFRCLPLGQKLVVPLQVPEGGTTTRRVELTVTRIDAQPQ